MQVTESEAGSGTLVVLDGRLDSATAPAVEARLLSLLAKGPVVADMGAVRYVSSAGLRVLLKAAKEAKASGTGFAVCSLLPPVREVFEVSGFDRIIAAHADRAAGLAALG
jgi:anti-anti-sigma factor